MRSIVKSTRESLGIVLGNITAYSFFVRGYAERLLDADSGERSDYPLDADTPFRRGQWREAAGDVLSNKPLYRGGCFKV